MCSPSQDSLQRILVEGDNDKHVLIHIYNRCVSSSPSFYVSSKGSINQLIASIEAEIDVDGREVLGIIADADDAPQECWKNIADKLNRAGIVTPSSPEPDGTIIEETEDKPRIGIWIMPDNKSTGELEDFVQQMIPNADPVWPLAVNFIEGIPEVDRKFADHKVRKAEVHAWLATRRYPRPMGVSIRDGDLDVDGCLCQKFRAWLERLLA